MGLEAVTPRPGPHPRSPAVGRAAHGSGGGSGGGDVGSGGGNGSGSNRGNGCGDGVVVVVGSGVGMLSVLLLAMGIIARAVVEPPACCTGVQRAQHLVMVVAISMCPATVTSTSTSTATCGVVGLFQGEEGLLQGVDAVLQAQQKKAVFPPFVDEARAQVRIAGGGQGANRLGRFDRRCRGLLQGVHDADETADLPFGPLDLQREVRCDDEGTHRRGFHRLLHDAVAARRGKDERLASDHRRVGPKDRGTAGVAATATTAAHGRRWR